MRKKGILAAGGRMLLSGVLAFIILTLFCSLYYNVPTQYENKDGTTDYKWAPDTFYCRGTEGYACGITNNEGFLNSFDYKEGMQIDVLLMGSSHMEAFQVGMKESTASRMDAMLGDETVYNIGISDHTFLTCVCNLEAAVKKYQPGKYIVIETPGLSFSIDDLTQALDGDFPQIIPHAGGVLGLLQMNPFLRLGYAQLKYMNSKTEIDEASSTSETDMAKKEKLLDILFQQMNETVQNDSSAKLIIVYHPGMRINSDGTLYLLSDSDAVQQFRMLCEHNGILFLDMSSRFQSEYAESFALPCGFSNSSVGSGHLNKYGHAMVADELYKLIVGVE